MLDGQDPNVTATGQVADGQDGATGADGQQTLGWRAELPDSLKQHEAFTGYKTKNELWNSHVDMTAKLKEAEGKLSNSIPKLAPDATDEQKAAYRAAMGIPAKAEEYEIAVPEGHPTELADAFKQFALSVDMPKEMAAKAGSWWNTFMEKVQQNIDEGKKKEHDENLAALKKDWGAEYDKNAEIVKAAHTAFKDVKGFNELLTMQIGGTADKPITLGNHPAMMSVFLEIGKKIVPDTTIPGSPQQGQIKEGMTYPNSPAP